MPRLWLTVSLFLVTAILTSAQQVAPIDDAPIPMDKWAAEGITPPESINKTTEEYPDDARIKQIDGLCSISLVVDTEGNSQKVRIVHCTDPSFVESSVDWARRFRFKPATTTEGKPVSVSFLTVTRYHLINNYFDGYFDRYLSKYLDHSFDYLDRHLSKAVINRALSEPIHYGFIPQRGGVSDPDPNGVYPLTRSVTAPRVIKFSDEGYGRVAFVHDGNGACDVLLTIGTKGKASDPQVIHCERPELEKPAMESLLKSEYKPGMVRGKEVSMRGSLHLDYGDVLEAGSASR